MVPGSQAAATQYAGAATWRSFAIKGYLYGLVRAQNGDLWAAAQAYPGIHTLSRITPAGKVTTYSISVYPQELAIDKSGNFWLTTARNEEQIVEITPSFHLKTFHLSSNADGGIIVGGDGNVWFTESFAVGKITPSGKLTEYTTPEIGGETGVTWSASGLVWFFLTSGLASIDAKHGALGTYSTPYGANQGALVAAADGTLWFFAVSNRHQVLVRFDPRTKRSNAYELPSGFGVAWTPGNLIQTSDGALWIGAQQILGCNSRRKHDGGLARFDMQTKTFTTYPAPNGYSCPWNLAAAPAGSIWVTATGAVYELRP